MLRLHSRLFVVLVALMLFAPAADAANVGELARRGDQMGITLSTGGGRLLSRKHIKLTAPRPASRRDSQFTLPDTSGSWNFQAATGTIRYSGTWRITVGRRTV